MIAGLTAFSVAWLGMAGAVAALDPAGAKEGRAVHEPHHSIRYEFGSKFASGYFVRESAACVVFLMVAERHDPAGSLPPTAARLRLALQPGQIAGLDSEEGRSLNLICGADAAVLLVDTGEREKLAVVQDAALRSAVGQTP